MGSSLDDCGPICQETLREIERFLDGELDGSVNAAIEHHLSDCNPCMQRTEFRRHLKVMISSKCGGDAVPDQLQQKVRDIIRGLDVPG
jgi:mycothiol system anti-sigma-R factor